MFFPYLRMPNAKKLLDLLTKHLASEQQDLQTESSRRNEQRLQPSSSRQEDQTFRGLFIMI
ncbi:hypothetical protein M3Y96_01063000 [Aphelenchoides besseyi]|nr:hypothetical protein M3Y96_01063000 [Aphelenchoides besseyi]